MARTLLLFAAGALFVATLIAERERRKGKPVSIEEIQQGLRDLERQIPGIKVSDGVVLVDKDRTLSPDELRILDQYFQTESGT